MCGERRKKKEHSINSLLVFLRHLMRSVLQKNCKPKNPFGSERAALWEGANLEGYRRQQVSSGSTPRTAAHWQSRVSGGRRHQQAWSTP